MATQAQSNTNTLPDLQTSEANFFDPTKDNKPEQVYHFSTPWRLEIGYAQLNHQTQDTSAIYLHGLRLGGTIDFILPHNFSIQTGALATFTYGQSNQHWPSTSLDENGNNDDENAQTNILQRHALQLQLTIPVRAYYNITLWRQLRMFLFAGPQLQIGLTNYDLINNKMSATTTQWVEQQGISTESKEHYLTHKLYRTNIQFGIGGGFEWDRYRLQAGYDFGLNNILRTPILPDQKMTEWGWITTFSYRL